MKELITMWKNTRMIVLTAVTAALYAAILIPFKVGIPLVPGFTEVRPANVIPIICSLMFGPAAAWGSAIGNTIADAFGTFGLGTIFGFIGNFLYGYIPYRIYLALCKGELTAKSHLTLLRLILISIIAGLFVDLFYTLIMSGNVSIIRHVLIFLASFISTFLVLKFLSISYFLIILTASVVCGVIIGWGVHTLGMVPFSVLANIITLNNFLASGVLGPILLPALYPAVKRLGLLYTDVMDEKDRSKAHLWASISMIASAVLALGIGNWIAIGAYDMGVLGKGFGQAVQGAGGLGLGLAPLILLIIISAVFL